VYLCYFSACAAYAYLASGDVGLKENGINIVIGAQLARAVM